MKKMKKMKKIKKNKKFTPLNDVGFGTKKKALADIGIDIKNFDTLNSGFGGDTGTDADFGYEDNLYDEIDELEDF